MADQPEWISLGEAAKLLGVHPTTVRNWADQNEIPFRRTPGRHRRFQRSVLEEWAAKKHDKEKPQRGSPNAQAIVEFALGHTRFSVNEHELRQLDWYEQMSSQGVDKLRQTGRRLLEALLHHLEDEELEAEELVAAYQLGKEYYEALKGENLTLVQAIRGFIYFDNFLVEAVIHIMAPRLSATPSEWSDLLQQINAFTNEVLVSMVSNYQHN